MKPTSAEPAPVPLGRRWSNPRGRARGVLTLAALSAIGGIWGQAPASAASWDPVPGTLGAGNGIVNGGTGNWDLSTANWTADNGATNILWVNGSPAAFAGTAGGLVTLTGSVTASSLNFDVTGDASLYTLQSQSSANVLTLGGALVTVNQSATINSPIGGVAGLTKQGAGTLTLGSTSNSFGGTILVTAGALNVSSDLNLGAGTNGVTLQSGGILRITPGVDFDPGGVNTAVGSVARVFTVGTGGGTMDVGTGSVLTINDANQLTGGGLLTKLGAGRLVLGMPGVGYGTFGGGVAVNAGTLELQSDTAAGTGAINVGPAGTLVNNSANVGNAITLAGGTLTHSFNNASFGGNVSVAAPSTIAATVAGKTLTLGGVLSGTNALSVDTAGGGALLVSNAANFNGAANPFTGNVTLLSSNGPGGSAALAYRILAPFGQKFSATAGTLTLGNSVPGSTVTLAAGASASASLGGVIELAGRAASTGVGVTISGDLIATSGGRVAVGDGASDASQIQLTSSSHLTADGGTILLRPRLNALTLDSSTTGGINLANGGVLAAGGNANLILSADVNQTGAWVLDNQGSATFRITGASQNTTAGLTLRTQSGVTRYEVDTVTLGSAAANGTLAVEPRGGTIDINNGAAGKTFAYAPGYVVSGWGQLGTSAANQTHVIPAGGATFYANASATSVATLGIVGGFDESSGGKAAFRIGDNDALMLTVPNASAATAYNVTTATIDAQGATNVARLIVGGGVVRANAAAFVTPNNKVSFEARGGGTLISDVSQTGTLLVTGAASAPINVTGGGSFVTTSSTFTLKSGETVGGAGTLFGFNGTTTTNLTLNGVIDLNGMLGGSINAASTGTLKLDGGETLTLGATADVLAMTLSYTGAGTAAAILQMNAASATARLGLGATIATVAPFNGTREFQSVAGTIQVDAADATSVIFTGVNQLSVDRTSDATANPTLLGTLTLSGGSLQIGTTASTNTISGLLSGWGTLGHATAIDSVVNTGTVRASGGTLTVRGAEIKGSGTWDPNGQTLQLVGTIKDFGGPTILRVSGSSGGTVRLDQSSTYTGGTVIDGSAGATPAILRVTAGGALGSGSVTLNSGILQLLSDSNLNFATTPIAVIGSGASTINYDHLVGTGSRTHNIGALTLGGQTLNLQGPGTSAYNYTLTIASTTVGSNGATIVNTSGSPVNTGPLALNGNLNLALGSFNMTVGALSGTGSINRSASTGTLNFNKSANGFSGSLFTSVGTTNFSASNVLGTGTYTFANGAIAVNSGGAGALSSASGTMTAGTFNLNTPAALDGASLNLAGGNLYANSTNALGTGLVNLTGGRLTLRMDASAAFGGTVNATGTNAGLLTVDKSLGGSGTGGTHAILGINVTDQALNLTSGVSGSGYGLSVTGATTISGSNGSTIDNEVVKLTLASLTLNGPLTLTGTGAASIGRLGGAGLFNVMLDSTLDVTGVPLASGFSGTVQVSLGTMNLNTVSGSLSGGSVMVNGGTLNLGVANALAGTSTSLASGFISANVNNALAGATVALSNGTLFAAANNALGNATINQTGGNVTATAPGALGTSNLTLAGGILALRSDAAAAFGGSVTVTGTTVSTVSVAKLTDAGTTGNVLSINTLALGGQTLNVTGADGDIFAVLNPVAMSGTNPTTINATAADAIFQGALTGAGPLVKTGQRTLTLGNGGNFGATSVNGGTLVVNGVWTTLGVTVGNSSSPPATLQLGGTGINSPGNVAINSGTLRIAKAVVTDALPLASVLTGGANGNTTIEYTGLGSGVLANTITIDTTAAARTLTLSSAGGTAAGQGSTFTITGLISRSGTNALNVLAKADAPLDDGSGNLLRAPSRLVLTGAQTFTTDLQHGGGIVIGKGNIPAGTSANPFGTSTNALQLNIADSTIGGMVADGQSSATFAKAVNTAGPTSPRKRLGAFLNPAGAAGTQTISFQNSFTWNDGSTPLYVVNPPTNSPGPAAMSSWNGLYADPNTVLQFSSSAPAAVLDNVLTASGSNVTSYAPIYVGGGGTVLFAAGFDESTYRNLATAKGLAGTATVLDFTTLQSNTTGHHFDAIELRSGTYRVGNLAQTVAGGFFVNPSPFNPLSSTSNLTTDVNLALTGVGAAKAFKIGAGQTLAKSGPGVLNVNGDQLHGAGATLAVSAGTVNLNTDGGMNNGGAPVNNLSVSLSGGAVNFAVTQHLAQLAVTGGVATLTTGTKLIEATAVSATGGKLDLTTNRLIVDYAPGNSPLSSIRQQVINGYNAAGTHWSGNGIVSSSIASDPTFALGYGEASVALGGAGGTFGGEAVDSTAVLVRYTKSGDANLDGTVDFTDLVALAQNYDAKPNALWTQGDFTYDGVVDFQDLVQLAQNYGSAVAADPVPGATASFDQDFAAAFAQAPEPATLGVFTIAGAMSLLRRRRRRIA